MNKFKCYIMSPEQSEYDKRLSTKIKRFNSERNLFLTNVYNSELNGGHHNNNNNLNKNNSFNKPNGKKNSIFDNMTNGDKNSYKNINNNNISNHNNNHTDGIGFCKETLLASTLPLPLPLPPPPPNVTEKIKGRVERTKSFFINGFMKRCKSSKDLFTSSTQSEKKEVVKPPVAEPIETPVINNKLLNNLDEFERNFLSSAGKKILVRELRKNFETADSPQSIQTQVTAPPAAPTPPKASLPPKSTSTPLIRLWKSKSSVSMQKRPPIKKKDKPVEETPMRETALNNTNSETPKKALTSRHSFYNTYRNEYLATSDKHSSNLSLNFCGTKPSITPTGSKSSKSLNTPFNRFSDYNFKRFSSSVNLTASDAQSIASSRNFSSSLYSVNSLCGGGDGGSYIYNGSDDYDRDYYSNGHYPSETRSLICPNLYSTPVRHSTPNGTHTFSDSVHDVTSINDPAAANDDSNEEDLFKIYVQCNNKINNINNENVKLRKCNSVSQIDLEMLKNELDDFIDVKWRSTNLCMGFRSQRRYPHRKVIPTKTTLFVLFDRHSL